jgi:hypothetical protein
MMTFNFQTKSKSTSPEDEMKAVIAKADKYLMKKVGLRLNDFPDTLGYTYYNLNSIINGCDYILYLSGYYSYEEWSKIEANS